MMFISLSIIIMLIIISFFDSVDSTVQFRLSRPEIGAGLLYMTTSVTTITTTPNASSSNWPLVCGVDSVTNQQTMDLVCAMLGFPLGAASYTYASNDPIYFEQLRLADQVQFSRLQCPIRTTSSGIIIPPTNFDTQCSFSITAPTSCPSSQSMVPYCKVPNPPSTGVTWNFTIETATTARLFAFRSDWSASEFDPSSPYGQNYQPRPICGAPSSWNSYTNMPDPKRFGYPETWAICMKLGYEKPYLAQMRTSDFLPWVYSYGEYQTVATPYLQDVSCPGKSEILDFMKSTTSSSTGHKRKYYFDEQCEWFGNTDWTDDCSGRQILLFCNGMYYDRTLNSVPNSLSGDTASWELIVSVTIAGIGGNPRVPGDYSSLSSASFRSVSLYFDNTGVGNEKVSASTMSTFCRLLSPFFNSLPIINGSDQFTTATSIFLDETGTYITQLGGGNRIASCFTVPSNDRFVQKSNWVAFQNLSCDIKTSSSLRDCNMTARESMFNAATEPIVTLRIGGQFVYVVVNNFTSKIEFYPQDFMSASANGFRQSNASSWRHIVRREYFDPKTNQPIFYYEKDPEMFPTFAYAAEGDFGNLAIMNLICQWSRGDYATAAGYWPQPDRKRFTWWSSFLGGQDGARFRGTIAGLRCPPGVSVIGGCQWQYYDSPAYYSLRGSCGGSNLAPSLDYAHNTIKDSQNPSNFNQLFIRDFSGQAYFAVIGAIDTETTVVVCRLMGYTGASSATVSRYQDLRQRASIYDYVDAKVITSLKCTLKTTNINSSSNVDPAATFDYYSLEENCDWEFMELFNVKDLPFMYSVNFVSCAVPVENKWNFTFESVPPEKIDPQTWWNIVNANIVIAESEILSLPQQVENKNNNNNNSHHKLRGTIAREGFSAASARVVCRVSNRYTFADRIRFDSVYYANWVLESFPPVMQSMACTPGSLTAEDCFISLYKNPVLHTAEFGISVDCDAAPRGLSFKVDSDTGVVLVKYYDDDIRTATSVNEALRNHYNPLTCATISPTTAIGICKVMLIQNFPDRQQEKERKEILDEFDLKHQNQVFYWYQDVFTAPQFYLNNSYYMAAATRFFSCPVNPDDSSDCLPVFVGGLKDQSADDLHRCAAFGYLSLSCGDFLSSHILKSGGNNNSSNNNNHRHETELFTKKIPWVVSPTAYNVNVANPMRTGTVQVAPLGTFFGAFGAMGTTTPSSLDIICRQAGFWNSTPGLDLITTDPNFVNRMIDNLNCSDSLLTNNNSNTNNHGYPSTTATAIPNTTTKIATTSVPSSTSVPNINAPSTYFVSTPASIQENCSYVPISSFESKAIVEITCDNFVQRDQWRFRLRSDDNGFNVVEALAPGINLADKTEEERFWGQLSFDELAAPLESNPKRVAFMVCRQMGFAVATNWGKVPQTKFLAACVIRCDASSYELHQCIKLEMMRCRGQASNFVYHVTCATDQPFIIPTSNPSSSAASTTSSSSSSSQPRSSTTGALATSTTNPTTTSRYPPFTWAPASATTQTTINRNNSNNNSNGTNSPSDNNGNSPYSSAVNAPTFRDVSPYIFGVAISLLILFFVVYVLHRRRRDQLHDELQQDNQGNQQPLLSPTSSNNDNNSNSNNNQNASPLSWRNRKRGDDLAGGNSGMSLALFTEAMKADVDMSQYTSKHNNNNRENNDDDHEMSPRPGSSSIAIAPTPTHKISAKRSTRKNRNDDDDDYDDDESGNNKNDLVSRIHHQYNTNNNIDDGGTMELFKELLGQNKKIKNNSSGSNMNNSDFDSSSEGDDETTERQHADDEGRNSKVVVPLTRLSLSDL